MDNNTKSVLKGQMQVDYWSEFYDCEGVEPARKPLPVTPLGNLNNVGDLKRFVVNVGRLGYLPTQATINFLTRRTS